MSNTSQIGDGGPAFPTPNGTTRVTEWQPGYGNVTRTVEVCNSGMSLRDWFAGMASDSGFAHFLGKYMAIAETNDPEFWKQPAWSDEHMAKIAQLEARYRMAVADAMMKARKQ